MAHNKLKPENIFITKKLNVFISDPDNKFIFEEK
jgi:hypothetical protein